MRTLSFPTNSPAGTRRLGVRISRLLNPGDVLLLSGDLGTGKTVLTQGIGEGLHVKEAVRSSSYVLVSEYHGRLTVYHADLYRLEDPAQVAELALEESASGGVLVVEWPDRAWTELPSEHLLIKFEWVNSHTRRITVEAVGERYEPIMANLGEPRKTEG